jgi:glutamate synthase domain-containing protein 2/glutamate synthase domain-containing protein 1/glutamate synthase domain-containing protein 3
MHTRKRPSAAGLYDPAFEHDACGVAFVARLNGRPTNDVLRRAFVAIDNMEHRGAEGADPDTGDGAGILIQLPDAFLRETAGFELPEAGRYGVAVSYLPREDECKRRHMEELLEDVVEREGQTVLGWRDVPTRFDHAGPGAQRTAPYVKHLFVGAAPEIADQAAFERKLYVIRRVAELASENQLIIPTFSSRTIVYKGMLTAPQLEGYFPDLEDRRMATALAIVHSRFSTNTFPSWELAHPYRMLAHNGEVNTLRGNVNWMRARESELRSELFGDDLERILPIVQPGGSDSAILDNVLELLVLSGRSLPHALMMMIPEPYQGRADMTEELKGFYDYHGSLMEPWDGPAAVAFTDGRVVGATLDRNGLRPGRWIVTRDGYVVMASEAGVLPLLPEDILRRGRLQPGHLLLVDLEQHRIVGNAELKGRVAAQKPYRRWYAEQAVHLRDLPERSPSVPRLEPLRPRQVAFGYTQEDLRVLLAPMAATGEEPTGSMGNDGALAVLSDRRPPLFSYFKQLFAQVTNPPIDPLRETIVMSLASGVGRERNLLEESPEHAHELAMDQPILRNSELEKVRQVSHDVFRAHTIDITWPVSEGTEGMSRAVERLGAEAGCAIAEGASILILSDRNVGRECAAIPSLLATSSVHHHLVRAGTRLRAGLVVESGEPREVHHMACLIGYGASAVNPYLAFETLAELHRSGRVAGDLSLDEAEAKLIKAIGKGLLKTISKMGISTIGSYCGAQIFEAVGLDRRLVDRHFSGTPSRIGGVGMEVIAREALDRHLVAYPARRHERRVSLAVGGVYAWRRGGEHHAWNPETVPALQRAVRGGGARAYAEYARQVNEGNAQRATLRGLLHIREDQAPIPLEEVEPSTEIVKRFVTGAMSLGSISPEAHETLAIAMNRLSGRSNTGEGGEDPRRYTPDPNGDLRRSAIKQVASARFGVTTEYLVNADQLQIKMAQGAKPGEGGQLPGHKVDPYIAKLRFSTPGVALISPPPHHDIYSIEDLKQLIYDLRCANPEATVSVKLAAEVGVGTVAAGVAKAGADHVVIAGHDGGTGASPLSSIQSAGVPWEIGLAETQQVLLMNDLRSRITVQADGQMRTGRDVVIAGLLGAEEMGFSTAPLIAVGCIMMRVCHLNTCPVGIATQDPELRRRFTGTPEHVVTYFLLVAEEARRIMASLGVATFADLIGRADLLESLQAVEHWKAQGVDLTELLRLPDLEPDTPRRKIRPQSPVLHDALDHELIERARPAIERAKPVWIESRVRNVNRTVGGLLSSAIVRARGPEGLPEGTVSVLFNGSAGQSFGAWLAPGVTLTLRGEANDYVGKGLCGGIVAVMPPPGAPYRAEENVVVGNTVLYGATGGRAFFRGLAGERFAVRNSGAAAVVEGVGDHGCEYMTGGRVIVLGPTGRNFAAGMSGGIAYVLDEEGSFASRCNMDLVGFDPLDPADEIELRDLVTEHHARTGSTVAAGLLKRWPEALEHFVKVMPRDYKRALREQAEREEAGRPLALDGASTNGAGTVEAAQQAVGESRTVAATEGL